MAGSVNKVILVGNLGKDPEIRSMPSGDRMATFSLATSETWRDRSSGERKEKTEWHNIAIFNDNLVKVAENYLRKGSKVYIEGSLQSRKYTDKTYYWHTGYIGGVDGVTVDRRYQHVVGFALTVTDGAAPLLLQDHFFLEAGQLGRRQFFFTVAAATRGQNGQSQQCCMFPTDHVTHPLWPGHRA